MKSKQRQNQITDKQRQTTTMEAAKEEMDLKYKQAAEAVHDADIFFLVTGAGFSADSGLAVYGDIAKIEAYKKQNLEYHDICQPHILGDDPEIFYGFWGQCMNDYRETKPHDGYEILKEWRDKVNEKPVAIEIQERIQAKYEQENLFENDEVKLNAPYQVDRVAKGFHIFTSNVDAHSYDIFNPEEIYDCHGNIELWQCSDRYCEKSGAWRAPLNKTPFVVDPKSMRAPQMTDTISVEENVLSEQDEDTNDSVAHIGQTKGSGERSDMLKFMPETKETLWTQETGCNWPRCHLCDSWARPAILMFGDFGWKYDRSQEIRYDTWMDTVLEMCKEKELKVCILEIGCGFNVPTCRFVSETMVDEVIPRGSEATLIRVNLDDPTAPPYSTAEDHIIPIKTSGLNAICKINEAMLERSER